MRLIEIYSLLLFILVAGADAKRKKPKKGKNGHGESSSPSTYDGPRWPYRWTGSYYNGTIVSDIHSLLTRVTSDMFPVVVIGSRHLDRPRAPLCRSISGLVYGLFQRSSSRGPGIRNKLASVCPDGLGYRYGARSLVAGNRYGLGHGWMEYT
jgi:hypothetical protein